MKRKYLSIELEPVCRIDDSHLLDLLKGYSSLEHSRQYVHLYVMIAMSTVGCLQDKEHIVILMISLDMSLPDDALYECRAT